MNKPGYRGKTICVTDPTHEKPLVLRRMKQGLLAMKLQCINEGKSVARWAINDEI